MPSYEAHERVSLIVCGMHEIGQKRLLSSGQWKVDNGQFPRFRSFVICGWSRQTSGERIDIGGFTATPRIERSTKIVVEAGLNYEKAARLIEPPL